MSLSFTKALAIFAVISVSGIHLAFMQAGAWAFMLWEQERQDDAPPISRLAVEIVSGANPCQRCLITRQASLESHGQSQDEKRSHHETIELRLIPADCRTVCLFPPSPNVRPLNHFVIGTGDLADTRPPVPPPRLTLYLAA